MAGSASALNVPLPLDALVFLPTLYQHPAHSPCPCPWAENAVGHDACAAAGLPRLPRQHIALLSLLDTHMSRTPDYALSITASGTIFHPLTCHSSLRTARTVRTHPSGTLTPPLTAARINKDGGGASVVSSGLNASELSTTPSWNVPERTKRVRQSFSMRVLGCFRRSQLHQLPNTLENSLKC